MVSGSAGLPNVGRHFPTNPKIVFLIVGRGPLEALEVGDVEQSLADCFPKCEGCCVCQCGSATLQICNSSSYVVINQHTHVTITNMQSHLSVAHGLFQLSRVGDCSSSDCFVRLVASSNEICCAGDDECLHPRRRERPQSQNRRSNFRCGCRRCADVPDTTKMCKYCCAVIGFKLNPRRICHSSVLSQLSGGWSNAVTQRKIVWRW